MISSRKRLLAFILVYIVLYGTSYQQFRHFNINETQGLFDARSHVAMSLGRYDNATRERRYRFVVPFLASLARKSLAPLFPAALGPEPAPAPAPGGRPPIKDELELINLSFYIVNFSFMAGAAFLLFLILERLGFRLYLNLIGLALFLGSRIAVLSAATPMVDSVYFFAIALISYLTITDRLILLALLNPLIILAKENICLVMLMPFLKREKWLALSVSLVVSAALLIGVREYVSTFWAQEPSSGTVLQEIMHVVMVRLGYAWPSFQGLFTARGLLALSSGFSFFLVFAAAGFWSNWKNRKYQIPHYLLVLIPISLFYCVLAPGYGRMFFATYVVVIPYALVFIERVVSRFEAREPEPGTR